MQICNDAVIVGNTIGNNIKMCCRSDIFEIFMESMHILIALIRSDTW